MNQDLFRIKQETNTIRLIASDKVIKILDLYELAYDEAFEHSVKSKFVCKFLILDFTQYS